MTFLLAFKSFILKITLIALIIKIFKKYSIIRRLFTLINTILFSIFGISMIDIYEIEFLSKIFNNLIDIFSKFHINILDLFGKKMDVPIETPSSPMRGIQPETTGIQTGNGESNRIIERFKRLIHKEEVIQEDNTPYYKNKYVIIAGLLVLSGLTWYFHDDIKPIISGFFAMVNISRSWSDTDSPNNSGNVQETSKSNIQSVKDWLSNKFSRKPKDDDNKPNEDNRPVDDYRPDSPDSFIELLNKKGKRIDESNLSQSELLRRGLEPQLTGLQPITGETEKFDGEAFAILRELNSFNMRHETNTFPHEQLQEGLYSLLKDRLEKLSTSNPREYNALISHEFNKNIINKFIDSEAITFGNTADSPAYDDVELSTIQEQDVWSDRADSPEQMLSPQAFGQTAMDSIEKERNIPQVIITDIEKPVENLGEKEPITPSNKLKEYWDGLKEKTTELFKNKDEGIYTMTILDDIPDDDLIGQEILPEARSLIQEVLNQSDEAQNNSSTGSTNSMEHYFPERTDPPSKFSALFDQIKSKRKDLDSPVEVPKPQIEINNPTVETQTVETSEPISQDNKNSGFLNLFSDIKSRRREYGTPNISNVGLPRPELSPLNIPSTSNLPDDNEGIGLEDSNLNKESHQVILPLHDWKEEVKLNIHKGSVGDRKIDFDLGENAKDIKSLHFITNDGISFAVNPNTTVNMAHTNTISWDIKGKSNPYWKDLDLYSVTLIDKAGKGTELYCNNKPKFLPCFKDNIGKRFT